MFLIAFFWKGSANVMNISVFLKHIDTSENFLFYIKCFRL